MRLVLSLSLLNAKNVSQVRTFLLVKMEQYRKEERESVREAGRERERERERKLHMWSSSYLLLRNDSHIFGRM
jgi:hypothetical protein